MILRFLALASVILLVVPARSQAIHAAAPSAATDAAWTRSFAVIPGPGSDEEQGQENALNGDPRLAVLLKASFHQRQWFWRDKGSFESVPDVVQTFIAVPGDALLDEKRYVTADGCVPHDCGDRGMLWIDTGGHPAWLIFVATGTVRAGSDNGPHNLLWIFTSSPLNGQQLPQQFLVSLRRWQKRLAKEDLACGAACAEQFLVANLVQPTGEIVVIAPSVLGLEPATGAKQ